MKDKFPLYRKLDGFDRYYKIVAEDCFFEVSIVNGQKRIQEVKATQFPEKLRIMDMIDYAFSFAPMTEEEIKNFFPE